MFKKLFISFIILSALTTEGVVNTSWNIYDLCLFVDSVNCFSKETDRVLEQQSNPDGKVAFSDLLQDNRLFTESKEIGQIKYSLSVKTALRDETTDLHQSFIQLNDRCIKSCSFINALPELYSAQNKDIILSVSDTSPPTIL